MASLLLKGKKREKIEQKVGKELIFVYLEERKGDSLRSCALSSCVLKCELQPTVWLITIYAAVNLFDQCHQYFTLRNNNN